MKIIDVSCPQQLLAIMKWIMEGNRGLVYVCVMRTESAVLYSGEYEFSFGKGYRLRQSEYERAVIISSGRGVHEALDAAKILSHRGIGTGVVDMPSVDETMLTELAASGSLLVFAEQNNGYLWQMFLKTTYRNRRQVAADVLQRVTSISTLDREQRPQFIHSATYEQLIAAFGLTPQAIAETVENAVGTLQK